MVDTARSHQGTGELAVGLRLLLRAGFYRRERFHKDLRVGTMPRLELCFQVAIDQRLLFYHLG